MARRRSLMLVLLLLIVGGAAVLLGEIEQGVDFGSVLETWADVLRDVDQFGLQLTRVSDREEMQLGQDIARSIRGRRLEHPEWDRYVSAVSKALLPYVRRQGIRYEFHVIDSRHVNAFALPGGQIFVLTGMLEFLESEAELAAILGHEIAHVDLRHSIERFQYELALKKVGMREIGQLAEVTRRVVTVGYTKYQEVEADAQGVRLSIQAGYDPETGAVVFSRLTQRFGGPTPPGPRTPLGELTRAMEEALGSYFRSHPASEDRARRLKSLVAGNRYRLSGRSFYVGVENYRQRIPRSQQELPAERRGF